ncbi:MAG: hypothetical protein HC827_24130 [Cyanobacteria bacterium RM1_2_2]|nr:hypothetical protein [Cyanobacteria bacterium RM1_2_2]
MNIYVSDTAKQTLSSVVPQVQAFLERELGLHYSVNDLEKALMHWLEASIEQLADDALYHCIEGDISFAFNRHSFTHALSRLKPAHTPAEADSVVA